MQRERERDNFITIGEQFHSFFLYIPFNNQFISANADLICENSFESEIRFYLYIRHHIEWISIIFTMHVNSNKLDRTTEWRTMEMLLFSVSSIEHLPFINFHQISFAKTFTKISLCAWLMYNFVIFNPLAFKKKKKNDSNKKTKQNKISNKKLNSSPCLHLIYIFIRPVRRD